MSKSSTAARRLPNREAALEALSWKYGWFESAPAELRVNAFVNAATLMKAYRKDQDFREVETACRLMLACSESLPPLLTVLDVLARRPTARLLYLSSGGTVYGGGHVPMIVVAAGVGHRVDSVFADHYSLLQTIEQNFGLPLLGNAGDTVQVSSLAALLH